MYNFILKRQPKAYQGSKTFKSNAAKEGYIMELRNSFSRSNTSGVFLEGELYGVVYYFYKRNTGTDADNISKPIWDCLKGVLFDDDKKIKLRIAGTIDISNGGINLIEFSNVPGEITTEILETNDNKDHFTYIECGLLKKSMYKFNYENHGN